MKKQLQYLLAIVFVAFTFSCTDIFEHDLSDDVVTLIAPSNGVVTQFAVQTFWWEEVDFANGYELQVVSERFDSIVQVILDTTVTGNQFSHTLYPGIFQWRVRAINGSSETEFTTYDLTVDTAAGLTGQTVLLSSPSNGSYFNSLTNEFTWQALSGATGYRIQLSDDGFQSTSFDTLTTLTTATITAATEGDFQWQVRAEDGNSVSQYSQASSFTIDTTAPGTPTLLQPTDNSTILTQPFDLMWQQVLDSGSPVRDSVYLYTDSLITLFDVIHSVSESHQDSLQQGSYFWRVRSFDEAGNQSSYSETFNFIVQ